MDTLQTHLILINVWKGKRL